MAQVVPVFAGTIITTSGQETQAHSANGSTVSIGINATVVSGTAPSAVFSIQWSFDGTTFFGASPVDTFAAVTAVGGVFQQFTTKSPYFRLAWAVTGTTPSFTMTINSYS